MVTAREAMHRMQPSLIMDAGVSNEWNKQLLGCRLHFPGGCASDRKPRTGHTRQWVWDH